MSWYRTPKIGDWIKPIDPIINEIHYGYNKRLIIEVLNDEQLFTTTCDAFGVEKDTWDIYNTKFLARVVLDE